MTLDDFFESINSKTKMYNSLIKNKITYSYKPKRNWFFGSKYIILNNDIEVLELDSEINAYRYVNAMNDAADNAFKEGVIAVEEDVKKITINFIKWTLMKECPYRNNGGNIWFNIENMNDSINTEELYEKYLLIGKY